MDVDREINEVGDQLRSNSLEDIESCSSSILNSSRHGSENDDDYEDGINVTLVSASAVTEAEETNVPPTITIDDSTMVDDTKDAALQEEEAQNDKKGKRLNGAARKRFKHLIARGHNPDDARVLAEKPFRVPYSDPSKRRRNAELNESGSSDTNPPKRAARSPKERNTSQTKYSVQTRLETTRKGGITETLPSRETQWWAQFR